MKMDFGLNFQVLDKIAEGDLIRLMVLAIELIASLFLSVITLSKSVRLGRVGPLNGSSTLNVTPNGTDSAMTSEAVTSLVVFSIMGTLYIAIAAGHFVWLWCKESQVQEVFKNNAARSFFTAIGGIFYYIGDNLPPLVEEYAQELNCGPVCVERTQVVGLVMLVIATTTYLPITINAVFKHNKDEDEVEIPACIVVFLLLAKITDLDLVYTAIERIIPNTCNESIVGGTWTYYIFYIAVFAVVTVYATFCICNSSTESKRIWAVINALFVCIFMACYILADNRLPLDCTGYIRDNRLFQDGLKVALLSVTFIIAIYSLTVFGVWKYIVWCDRNKVSPFYNR